jgi:hypothetical protein
MITLDTRTGSYPAYTDGTAKLYMAWDGDSQDRARYDSNTTVQMLVWTDAEGAEHRDLVTCARLSPSGGWNTSIERAAVEFLRKRGVRTVGWNA